MHKTLTMFFLRARKLTCLNRFGAEWIAAVVGLDTDHIYVLLEVDASFLVIFVQLWNEELLEHVELHTFHARGTVVPNTATASAPAFEIKMATITGAERAPCVFWFEETKSATQVQRKFRTKYRKEPPNRPTIYSWHTNFVQTGCSVRHAKSPGRPCVSDATVEQLRESFVRVHESQRDLRLGKLVFQILLCGECYENVYT